MVVIIYDAQVERFEPLLVEGLSILCTDDGCIASYE
jgi:hypothetical protein